MFSASCSAKCLPICHKLWRAERTMRKSCFQWKLVSDEVLTRRLRARKHRSGCNQSGSVLPWGLNYYATIFLSQEGGGRPALERPCMSKMSLNSCSGRLCLSAGLQGLDRVDLLRRYRCANAVTRSPSKWRRKLDVEAIEFWQTEIREFSRYPRRSIFRNDVAMECYTKRAVGALEQHGDI